MESLSAEPQSLCSRFLSALRLDHQLMQPEFLKSPTGKDVLFFNRDLAQVLRKNQTVGGLIEGVRRLQAEGSFDIKVSEEGYVVAADSRGTYSRAIWARDTARVIASLEPEPRKRAISRLLKIMMNPLNVELFGLNILQTDIHRESSEKIEQIVKANWNPLFEGLPFESTMFVPHIRFLVAQLKDPSVKPERWNMKQNDGLALVMLEGLRALDEGILKWQDLEPDQRAYFAMATAYALRTQYWEKFDAGAWEEANGRRTSSIGLYATALRKFVDSAVYTEVVNDVASNPIFARPGLRSILAENLKKEAIENAIRAGEKIVLDQIERGEVPDRYDDKANQAKRYSDAALAHLLWYMPSFLSEDNYRSILKHLDQLRRAAGVIRYEGDVYLTLGQFFPPDESLPIELERNRGAKGPVYLKQIHQAFWEKNSESMREIYGSQYEAQWSLADLIEMQALPRIMELFADSPYRAEYEGRLMEVTWRSLGLVTGVNPRTGTGPLALDGLAVNPWKFAEAWIPARIYEKDGRIETAWVASKFTPLNWATAEARIGFERALRIYENESQKK